MRECVIFDLDGTLTKSEEGIWNCVRYAAERMGFPVPDEATLRRFVGPPLKYSFMTYMGMDEAQADRAVETYRERYTTVGLFENRVYPGIRRLLRTLKSRGAYVAVATGKPQGPSERIIEHFGLSPWIDKIVGPKNSAPDKEALIRAALPERYDAAWMVGDTRFDMEGGRRAGVRTLGVGYGYGGEAELRQAGCNVYAATVQEAIDLLCPGSAPARGAFVSMEGMDGCGKTTQMNLLEEGLTRYGFEVTRSREPGGSPIGEKVRELLLDPANAEMTAETEALLYAASRAQHTRQVIRPAIAAGRVLLCDRFVDSSIAYQGGGRGLGVAEVTQINAPAVDGTLPDATVYLDIDRWEALRRRASATGLDRLEMEGDDFHGRVEAAYRELIRRDGERFIVVDASRSPQEIGDEVLRRVLARLAALEEAWG